MTELLKLAQTRIINRKRNSILQFLICLISLSAAIISLSIYGSILKTNNEFRKSAYGDWSYLVSGYTFEKSSWLEQLEGVHAVGEIKVAGLLNGYAVGTIDENVISGGRLKIDQGKWPENPNEIAMEADLLSSLGYDYEIGQTISLDLSIRTNQGNVFEKKDFILSGIIHEYTNVWLVSSSEDEYLLPSAVMYSLENLITKENVKIAPLYSYCLMLTDEFLADQVKRVNLMNQINQQIRETSAQNPDKESTLQPKLFINSKESLALSEENSTQIYIILIALVAFIGLIAIFLIDLPSEVRFAAILRNLGISRKNLCILSILESFPILISAAILSIPLSGACLYAVLNLMKYADSYSISVELPFLKIIGLYLLWFVIAAISKLFCSVYALSLDAARKKRNYSIHWKNMNWIKEGLILCPLCVLCTSVFYGGIEGWYQKEKGDQYNSVNHYVITNDAGISDLSLTQQAVYRLPISESMLSSLSGVSGVEKSAAYTCMDIEISREGTKRQTTPLVVINSLENSRWKQLLSLSDSDWDKFVKGDLAVLGFPDNSVLPEHLMMQSELYTSDSDTWNYAQLSKNPTEVILHFLNSAQEDMGQVSVLTTSRHLSREVDKFASALELHSQCTVLISSELFGSFMNSLDDQTKWFSIYQAKSEFPFLPFQHEKNGENGADTLLLWADQWKNNTFTDNALASFCKNNNLSFTNNRQKLMVRSQELMQNRILIAVLAVCTGMIAIFVSSGISAVELQNELRFFERMRKIGMSRKQMILKIGTVTGLRAFTASFAGYIFYMIYRIRLQIYEEAHPIEEYYEPGKLSVLKALDRFTGNCSFYGIDGIDFIWIGIAAICLIMLLTILSKRKLFTEFQKGSM